MTPPTHTSSSAGAMRRPFGVACADIKDSLIIREENPHLVLGSVCEARKMGFPEVILPGDARNELYVTVSHGSFSKGGGKSSERNIELSARVADCKGRSMP
ncbi:Dedicator of cytokinesis protein 1, partial [Operophtera brumata]